MVSNSSSGSNPVKAVNPASSAMSSKPAESSFAATRFGSFAYFCVQHPDLFRFVVQVCFSIIVLSFCINQLATGGTTKDGKNDAIYWGGITSILAWWMPSPGGNKPQNQANVGGNLTVQTTPAAGTLPSGTGNGSNLS